MPDLSLFDLTGKKALVTGAAVGIGRGCALALAKAGADVAIVDLNEKAGQKTVAEIRALGRDSLWVRCDVTRREEVQAMVGRIAQHFGRVDVAVNNAGIAILGADEALPQADWDKVVAVNLTGVFLCAQAEAQQMLRQTPVEGKIINIASIAGVLGRDRRMYQRHKLNGQPIDYAAAKAGVIGMTRDLAGLLSPLGVHVNCISPGGFDRGKLPAGFVKDYSERTPLGRMGRDETDLRGAVLFLASPASDYVTGHNLVVDGGFTIWQ